MSLPEPRRLVRHVAADLPASRLSRQWAAVDARVRSTRLRSGLVGRRWFAPMAVVLAVAVAVVFVRGRHHDVPSAFAGAVLESGERDSLTLPDGTQLTLASRSQVRLVSVRGNELEILLQQGGIDLDVPHRSGRQLEVHVGPYDVIDVGTRFRVELGEGGRCTVSVMEGAVEIRREDGVGEPRKIGAGETWSSAPPSTAVIAPRTDSPSDSPSAASPTDEVPPAAGVPAAAPQSPPPASPTALFEAGTKARSAGKAREAAIAFDTLRRRYRSDPRAGTAAFELGRLRLDSFNDARGAVEALSDAIALAPNGPFREDAEARRVEALEVEGSSSCAAARDAYLTRYPTGIHATMVTRRCRGN
jgi:transmembrane sensor